jgi:YidC/Oxa1 family membrane protein insertase
MIPAGLIPSAQLLGAENSFIHLIGEIFHPVFIAIATVLAAIYSVIPNYAIAIAVLTILIMAILTPLTVKSTKSMIKMQALQPEIKRLQQKYKGQENRQLLSEELMRLYKERGVNPAGSCLPMFLQMPFLLVLYDIIRGLTNTVIVHGHTTSLPRYIPTSSKMYHDLVTTPGRMEAFGINLALKPFSHHPNWYGYVPFFVLVGVAVVLQYIQMSQMTKRNPAAAQANPGMQRMQKIMPIFFAYIYFLIPAAVVIYMVVSTAIRILTQDVLFRTGIVQQPAGERVIPGSSKGTGTSGKGGLPSKGGPPPKSGGSGKGRAIEARSNVTDGEPKPAANGNGSNGSANGARRGNGSQPGSNRPPGQRRPPTARTGNRSPAPGNRQPADGDGNTDGATDNSPKVHPRAKNKRTRKAR